MRSQLLQPYDPDAAVFTVSVAAQLAGMHPQTLRGYDRLGLVSPRRTRGRGRRYSRRDIARLRLIQRLSQEEGINLPGIRRILALQDELRQAERQIDALTELLREATHQGALRVFTADSIGRVDYGWHQAEVRELAPGHSAAGRGSSGAA